MNYDGLIFDIDGILVDVSQSYRETIRKTACFFLNRNVKKEEVTKIKNKIGMNNDWDATYSLVNNSDIPFDTVKSYFQSLYLGTSKKNGLINKERLLIPLTKLKLLKKKYKKLGIATGRPRNEAKYVLNKNKLSKLFDYIVAMEDVKKGKSAPDMILSVIKKLKLKNTVYIGDSPSDVIASKRAGIPSIYVGKQNIGSFKFRSVLQVIKYLL